MKTCRIRAYFTRFCSVLTQNQKHVNTFILLLVSLRMFSVPGFFEVVGVHEETLTEWSRLHCYQATVEEGLNLWSIKANPFNMRLKEVSFIWETVHSVTVMFLISHTYYTRLQSQPRVIGLWWAVRRNLKVLSICNVLERLPHSPIQ